jgi:hypothetical protein
LIYGSKETMRRRGEAHRILASSHPQALKVKWNLFVFAGSLSLF